MKGLPCTLLLFLFILNNGISQHLTVSSDNVYGPDPTLYNGKRYAPTIPFSEANHPFLTSPRFTLGEIVIKQHTYRNLLLNYDIQQQQLLLQFSDRIGTLQIIEVSKAWLTSFTIGNKHFVYANFGEGSRFYQEYGNGSVKIYSYWKKEMRIAPGSTAISYNNASRVNFLLVNGALKPIRNKKSLLSAFDQNQKGILSEYLHNRKFRFNKATENDWESLANFIGGLKP